MFRMCVSVEVYDYGPVTRCEACVTFEIMNRSPQLMSLTLRVVCREGGRGPYTVPLPPDYWMDALNCTQQNPVRARPPNHQTERRIWSVHPRADVRLLPSRTPHDAASAGEALRLGREARGCSAAHALFDLRQKAMHGACRAVDGAARLQIPLENGKAVPTGCSAVESLYHVSATALRSHKQFRSPQGPYPTTKRRVSTDRSHKRRTRLRQRRFFLVSSKPCKTHSLATWR
jgi:hypothetical protein